MRTEDFIKAVSRETEENERFEELRKGLPIGVGETGNILLAQKQEKTLTVRNTCVTGTGRTNYIRRLIMTLSCLYEKSEACFFVLSPKIEYGELLRLHSADVTAPYIRDKKDLTEGIETLKELVLMRETGLGYPKLFLILDGLETLPECNKDEDLIEYRDIYKLLMRKDGIEIITGVDLTKSIFVGYPGAFLGVGNCLITVNEDGTADVTYVSEDSSLSLPVSMQCPCEPSVAESIAFLNAIPAE